MCTHRVKSWACLILAVAWLAGCMKQPSVPVIWPLPTAQDALLNTHGGWIRLQAAGEEINGELIAVELPRIWILTEYGVRTFASAPDVTRVELILYKNRSKSLGAWAVLGFLSTLSHGGFLLISAPIWLLGGISISSSESTDGWLTFPRYDASGNLTTDWAEIAKFARFPQGLPKDLDLSRLYIKSPLEDTEKK